MWLSVLVPVMQKSIEGEGGKIDFLTISKLNKFYQSMQWKALTCLEFLVACVEN